MILTWRYALQSRSHSHPENRNHSQAFGCCQACPMTDLVLPRLQARQRSLSVTFSIQTHNRCISKAFQHFKSYRMYGALLLRCIWDRMQSNSFGRLHSRGRGHDWALQWILPRLDDTHLAVWQLIFFRPTPDDSRQVVYPAGKTIAFCKFTRQGGAFSRVLKRLARNTKIVSSPQRWV